MEKVNNLIEFLVQHLGDKRISIHKLIKYGYRYYYINFYVDSEINTKQSSFSFRDSLEITFDNRNQCIEVHGEGEERSLIIEDQLLLKKWSDILEEIVSRNLEQRCQNVFEKSLSQCSDKGLYREFQIKKLLKDDESL